MSDRLLDILRGLRLGTGIAEREDEAHLRRWFVQTSQFENFVDGEVDLVLGPKGSGKTAMFRIICDGDYESHQLRSVDIVPAFSVTDALAGWEPYENPSSVTLEQMRGWWNAYIKAIVANHLANCYGETTGVDLRDMLDAASLRMPDWTARSAGRLSRWLNPSPIQERDTAKLVEGAEALRPEDLEEIFDTCIALLRSMGRSVWVVFDRLDEAFYEDPDFEAVALRALLAAHRDISVRKQVKTKLFLRDDLFRRVTAGTHRVVNLSHLNEQTILWDRDLIRSLIARRLVANDTFRMQTGARRPDANSREGQVKILAEYIPPATPSDFPQSKRLGSMFEWIIEYSTDASGRFNPRNVLSLLEHSRRAQIALCDSNSVSLRDNDGYMISARAIARGSVEFSKTHLEKTIRAEYPEIRDALEALEGHSREVTVAGLRTLLDIDGDEAQHVARRLHEAGVLKRRGGGRFEVSSLFVPALRCQK